MIPTFELNLTLSNNHLTKMKDSSWLNKTWKKAEDCFFILISSPSAWPSRRSFNEANLFSILLTGLEIGQTAFYMIIISKGLELLFMGSSCFLKSHLLDELRQKRQSPRQLGIWPPKSDNERRCTKLLSYILSSSWTYHCESKS